MKRFIPLVSLFLLVISVQFTHAQEPPLRLIYQYPHTFVVWDVEGCILVQVPGHPVTWFDQSCGQGGIYSLELNETNENLKPAVGMKLTLQKFDGTPLATVIVDERFDNPYAVFLPQVVKQ